MAPLIPPLCHEWCFGFWLLIIIGVLGDRPRLVSQTIHFQSWSCRRLWSALLLWCFFLFCETSLLIFFWRWFDWEMGLSASQESNVLSQVMKEIQSQMNFTTKKSKIVPWFCVNRGWSGKFLNTLLNTFHTQCNFQSWQWHTSWVLKFSLALLVFKKALKNYVMYVWLPRLQASHVTSFYFQDSAAGPSNASCSCKGLL